MTRAWLLRRDRLVPMLLAVGLAGTFVAVQRAQLISYDGYVMFGVAKAILHGRLSITRADDLFGHHTPYSSYGIGPSLLMAPLYALQKALNVAHPALVTLMNPILLVLVALVMRLIGRELGWSARLAVLVPIGVATLTMALQASTDLFSEPGVSLALACVILGCLRWRRESKPPVGRPSGAPGWQGRSAPWWFGGGLALGILFRSDSILLVGLAVPLLVLFVPLRRLAQQRRELVTAAAPVLAALAWTAYYAQLRNGSPIPQQYGGTFSTPLLGGLHGLLATWGKGFFVYNPVLVLALPGVVLLWRRDRALAVLLAALSLARLLFFARWNYWFGGVCWGPRFLEPLTLTLGLLSGETLAVLPRLPKPGRQLAFGAVGLLAVASAAVSVASIWIGYEVSWRSEVNALGLPPPTDTYSDPRFRQENLHTFSGSALGWNLHHLSDAPAIAPAHFRGGPSAVGVLSLLAAVGGCTGGLALAGHRDTDGTDSSDDDATSETSTLPPARTPTRVVTRAATPNCWDSLNPAFRPFRRRAFPGSV